MGKQITDLKAQKRKHQRVNVYLDGEYAFGLSRIVAAWLHVGQELSPEKIKELKLEDELEYAYHHSKALLFPSIAEGFGLPIVEAMQATSCQEWPDRSGSCLACSRS